MKIRTTIATIIILLASGCGSGAPPKAASNPNVADKYPLETCVVSGEKLGSMGEPFVIKPNGRTVKLCCSKCLKEFNADPAKYIAILDEAEKKSNAAK